jgi:hypothetical protein
MKLKRIYTDRLSRNWPSYHIIYEWENELSNTLNLPLVNSPMNNFFFRKCSQINNKFFMGKFNFPLNKTFNFKNLDYLYFEMNPMSQISLSPSNKTIPVIIDFWEKSKIDLFKKTYSKCSYLLITNLEVLNFLKENEIKNKLIHFPMSLPSLYKLNPNQFFEKKYDIVIVGRINSILWNYLKKYEKQYPEIEYLHQIQQNGQLYYNSNKRGLIGNFHTRMEYVDLIRSSKITFYSTPGIDGGEARTNGFNPVTPRFFELLSAGCHILARYPKTLETNFYNLEKICPSINSYDEFEKQLNNALNSPPPIKKNSEYLEKHYTSTRIELLEKII